jgi:Tfp pilus assembly protein PilF
MLFGSQSRGNTMKRRVALFAGLATILGTLPAFADYKPGDPVQFGKVHQSYGDSGRVNAPAQLPDSTPTYSAPVQTNTSTSPVVSTPSVSSTNTHASTTMPTATSSSPSSGQSAQASTSSTNSRHGFKNAVRAFGAAASYVLDPNSPVGGTVATGAATVSGGPMPNGSATSNHASSSPPTVAGGYNPSENHPTGPAVPKRETISQNPEGSLNFSSPITARGPFSINGAVVYYRQKNWNGLLDFSRGWAAAEPNNGRPWFCLGEAAFHLGNYDAAVEGFRRATMYLPKEPKPWNNLADAYCKRQQWALAGKAIADGEAASSAMCTATDWYVFGNARKDLQDFEGASVDYKRAIALRPNFTEAINNWGVCQYNLGNTGEAGIAYNHAAKHGDQAAKNNAAGLQAEQQAAQARQQAASDPGNVYNWAQKSLNAKRAEENSRRDINGNTRERQY